MDRTTSQTDRHGRQAERTDGKSEQETLRVFELEQSSTEWLIWRQKGIGSSDAPVIVNGIHFETDRKTLWLEKLGRIPRKVFDTFVQDRMRRGQVLEPDARRWYEYFIEKEVTPLCCVHTTNDWLRASLDGWVAESRVVLEIKSPGKKDHYQALEGRIPEKYVPQCNHLLLATGATALHYLSYAPHLPMKERYALVRLLPDANVLRNLLHLEERFWDCLVREVEPEDHLFITGER